MLILGLSAYHPGASAALLRDGVPVAAASEEHFTRERHAAGFPTRALRHCLRAAGVESRELDHVVFHERPLRRFERVLVHQLRAFPRSRGSFAHEMFQWLGERLWVRGRIADELGLDIRKVAFCEHALAHAAWAFASSGAERAAVLVADDAGEWSTTTLVHAGADGLRPLAELRFPHSPGLLVSAVAEWLGLQPGAGGERALMELAAHGTPRLADAFARILQVDADGSLRVDTAGFRFTHDARRLCDDALAERLGPPRRGNAALRLSPDDPRDADLAASCRQAVAHALLALARTLHARTGEPLLCLAGELARHGELAGRLLRDGSFEQLWIPPAPGDAGLALGAALRLHALLGHAGGPADAVDAAASATAATAANGANGAHGTSPRTSARAAAPVPLQPLDTALGEPLLLDDDARPVELADDDAVVDALLEPLLRGELVARVHGRAHVGGRSLGDRAALIDPRDAAHARRLLATLKAREAFRPFGPVLPAEQADAWIELPAGGADAARCGRLSLPARAALRERAPAVVHVDGSTRPVLVDAARDPLLHRLLLRFGEHTGVPVLLHTTLNARGRPAVRSEAEALDLLRRSALTTLVVERRLHRAHDATAPGAQRARRRAT